MNGFTSEKRFAAVRSNEIGQQIKKRCFARTIRANEARNAAWPDGQTRAIDGA